MNFIGRILLYGIAFGSAAAALTYVHYVNGLYAVRNIKSAITIAGPMVIVGLAAFMFIRSMSMAEPGVKMGKALFGAMCVGALVAMSTIMCYGIVMGSNNAVRTQYEQLQYSGIDASLANDSTLTDLQKLKKAEEMRNNLRDNLSTTKFGLVQLQMYLSTALVVSLITFLYRYKDNTSA